jgi:opacity protein-like surface antigen
MRRRTKRKKTMKPTFAASALALALVLPATEVVAQDWGGAYVGLSGGYSWGDIDSGSATLSGKKAKLPIPTDVFETLEPSAADVSVMLGYRMQSGSIVYGGEIGASYADATDSVGGVDLSFGNSVFARALVGYDYADTLFFASLGVVGTEVDLSFSGGDQDLATGLSVGVGLERVLSGNWAWRTELIHTMYSDYDLQISPFADLNMDFSRTSVQIGLTYRY